MKFKLICGVDKLESQEKKFGSRKFNYNKKTLHYPKTFPSKPDKKSLEDKKEEVGTQK